MKPLRPGALLVFVLLSSALLFPEDKPWTEVRSPHFRLMTNGSERNARQVLRGFELMRAVFEEQFPGFKLDAPAPLLIIAPKDEYTAKQLLPQFWAHEGTRVAGLYHHGWEREYALVRLDTLHTTYDPGEYATVYHEYIHSLLHINFRWLPAWLDEGLAQFYSFTRLKKTRYLSGHRRKMPADLSFSGEKIRWCWKNSSNRKCLVGIRMKRNFYTYKRGR